MKSILVTGGLGYIGSHAVVELHEAGYEVVIVDDLSNSKEEVHDRIAQIIGFKPKWYKMDVNDTDGLTDILKKEAVDGIIHFAAFLYVDESVRLPLKYFNNNVGGMLSVMQAMSNADVNKIVFSSSCTVYGDTDKSPIDESEPRVKASSPYGTSKIICEELLEDCAANSPLRCVSLRYFNPVGAHPSALIGELPLGVPSHLVPYITQTAAGIREQLTVFGQDYPTPDGTNIRDYVHVVDVAKAHIKALEFCAQNNFDFEVFNLGTGVGNSVLEVIKSFEKTTGLKLKYRFGQRRAGDVIQIWANPNKAKDKLGWTAELSLDDMMSTAWKWQNQL